MRSKFKCRFGFWIGCVVVSRFFNFFVVFLVFCLLKRRVSFSKIVGIRRRYVFYRVFIVGLGVCYFFYGIFFWIEV